MPQLTILVVDDDEGVREYTAQVLEDAGYAVKTAAGADEAEALLTAEPLDLLITDIVLPGRDGIELTRLLRRLQPRARVLFTTGYTRHIAPELPPGAVIVEKPYQRDGLLHAITHLLGAELV